MKRLPGDQTKRWTDDLDEQLEIPRMGVGSGFRETWKYDRI